MAPLPKRRHSRARQGKRRRAIILKNITFESCPQCGALKKPHIICSSCGGYKGKVFILKKEKKEKKKKSKG